MSNKDQVLHNRLESKRKELKQRQEYFLFSVNNEMSSNMFERNAINDLMIMMQLKTEIHELEFQEGLK